MRRGETYHLPRKNVKGNIVKCKRPVFYKLMGNVVETYLSSARPVRR
jgi:hypothetical protein